MQIVRRETQIIAFPGNPRPINPDATSAVVLILPVVRIEYDVADDPQDGSGRRRRR